MAVIRKALTTAPELRRPPLAAALVALAVWLAALALYTQPARLSLDATQLPDRAADLYRPEMIDGRVAAFTRERP
ncbi:MAG: hypothetical protein RLZZ387_4644, partial [Chloroflexota bacterium]